jgi:hypothetical protein
LESGDDAHLSFGQRLADAIALDFEDLGLGVHGVGDDSHLAAREAHGVDADVGQRHAHERHRDALTGGEEHVHLAARMSGRHLVGEFDEVVGGLAHRRHDDHDIGSVPLGVGNVFGHGADALRIGYRGAAELLHDECHGNRRLLASPLRGNRKTRAQEDEP